MKVFVESEMWPNMLACAHRSAVPLALINARMSERTLRGWQRAPRTAQSLLSVFRSITPQNDEMRRALIDLGAGPGKLRGGFNLKSWKMTIALFLQLHLRNSSTTVEKKYVHPKKTSLWMRHQESLLMIISTMHLERNCQRCFWIHLFFNKATMNGAVGLNRAIMNGVVVFNRLKMHGAAVVVLMVTI